MSDEAWRRHANPWSVYTRFATIPPLVLAIWSRTWIGWWCLGILGLVAVWLLLNPHVFAPIHEPTMWASKGIYAERIWATEPSRVLLALAVWPTVTGVTLVVLAQLWRTDRMVWMYEGLSLTGPRGELPDGPAVHDA